VKGVACRVKGYRIEGLRVKGVGSRFYGFDLLFMFNGIWVMVYGL